MVDTRFPVSVHIMVSLAYHQDELMNSDQLAAVLRTNPTFVRRLVSRLVDAGLVQSFRGREGGIRLARHPKEINLKEIYIASTEEKTLLCTPKKPTTKACPVSCSMSDILCQLVDGIENSTHAYLAKLTLHNLLKKVAK